MSRRAIKGWGVLALSAVLSGVPAYAGNKVAGDRAFQKPIPKEQRIDHALNRLTFGARPGDVERVKALGLKKWMDRQLHPGRIPENPDLIAKLHALDTLEMTSRELVRNYPAPQMLRQMAQGALPYPADPERRRILAELAARTEQTGGAPPPEPDLARFLQPGQVRWLRTGSPQQRLAAFEAIPQSAQDALLPQLPPGILRSLSLAAPPDLRRRAELAAGPAQVVTRDLSAAKLLRAVYSDRQLQEILVDFWFNHFNVFLDKGADHYLVTAYERDVIRPLVLGKFRDLLEATARSPAMLFYLDNWQSVASAPARGRAGVARRGLNENYARELMELHTLGVDGGYTQKDVTEVARCFTGWSIRQPQLGGEFFFNAAAHDRGEKIVLGVKIPAGGGVEDGEKVLDILARRPATARYISRELAVRFVADHPPRSLVDRMARTFLHSGGDLRAVMKTMLNSKEFWSVGAYRAKIKSPLEMVVSAVRAADGTVDWTDSLDNQVTQMGEPLYRKLEPAGYSNSGQDWLNSASLLARMNFGWNLANHRIPGVTVSASEGAKPGDPGFGLTLGSPDFQKH